MVVDEAELHRALIDDSLRNRTGLVKVVVELTGTPAAAAYATERKRGEVPATVAVRSRLREIERTQQQLINRLASVQAQVIYRTQRVYNGVAIQVDATKLATIAQFGDVAAIHPLTAKTLDHTSSVPLIGAPQVWTTLSTTGRGIRIGIIDTGIDYIHTNFGGSGLAADYTRNITNTVSDNVGFPSVKVMGGYDFAGDSYNASAQTGTPAQLPSPDPDPMDCNGHGSHVAGTAGGYGVRADGTTFTGPFTGTIDFPSLRIGPGVAPEVSLYALKVFGCEGSTDVTDEAIEYAVDPNGDGDFSDRMDVINMSLGSAFGSRYDTTAVAADNAVLAGVIVVASAGNSGDTAYVTGSPGAAGRAISVASSQDAQDMLDGFQVKTSTATVVYVGSNATSYSYPTGPVSQNLVYPSSQQDGCQPFNEANKALLLGKIVLLDWSDTVGCSSLVRVTNAATAGALGVVLGYHRPVLDTAIGGSTRIPAIITPHAVGKQLKDALAQDQTLQVTLTPAFNRSQPYSEPSRVDTLSAFSSRGPRRGDSALKPDIAAPGQSIFSTGVRSGNQGLSLNGTSMAAPHVAGAMALLRQLHPGWSVEELKALAMNTATNELRASTSPTSTLYSPQRVGAGRLTLQQAATNQVIAYNNGAPGLVSVSFGALEVLGSLSINRTVRVSNKGMTPATYNLGYSPRSIVPGVTYAFSPTTLTVAPGGIADVTVTLTANAPDMRHTADPTLALTQNTLPRQYQSEASGLLTLTPIDAASADVLRVPLYAAPRPASDMQAGQNQVALTSNVNTVTVPLTGTPINTGSNFPLDERSVVTAFELQLTSPDKFRGSIGGSEADLKYVGVASDVRATQFFTQTMLYFGLATHGDWSTPSGAVVQFEVYIDTNRDGRDDFVLLSYNATASQTEAFVTTLLDLHSQTPAVVAGAGGFLNGLPANVRNTVVYNTNVMVLPVNAARLGLTATNARFNYRVVSFSRDYSDPDGIGVDNSGGNAVDGFAYLTYDAANPGFAFQTTGGPPAPLRGIPAYDDLPDTTIPFEFNRNAYTGNRSQGLLLLHHHNRSGDRDEVVGVNGYQIFMPVMGR